MRAVRGGDGGDGPGLAGAACRVGPLPAVSSGCRRRAYVLSAVSRHAGGVSPQAPATASLADVLIPVLLAFVGAFDVLHTRHRDGANDTL